MNKDASSSDDRATHEPSQGLGHSVSVPSARLLEIIDLEGFLSALKDAIGPRLDALDEEWQAHKPAAMAAFEATGARLDWIGGNCPVQAEGDVDGMRFYFRARGDEWQFHVAERDGLIFEAPVYYHEQDYGDGPYDAGWMPLHEAMGFIVEQVFEYRAQGMEAGTAETTGSAEGDSPVRKDAPQ